MSSERQLKSESGYQLFNRLSIRPTLENLHPKIFPPDYPKQNQVIQIVGSSGSGKSRLLCELIARCILPNNSKGIPLPGKNAHAIFINTDHHINILSLIQVIEMLITPILPKTHQNTVIEDSLKRLIVLNCYSSEMLKFTFQNLERMLMENLNVSLVAVDSLSAYYWYDRFTSSKDMLSMNKHVEMLLEELASVIGEKNVITVFTMIEVDNFKFLGNKIDVTLRLKLEEQGANLLSVLASKDDV